MFRPLRPCAWIVILLGCSELVNPNCTDVGCSDALRVQVAGDVPAAFTLRLPQLSPGPWEFECTGVTCGEPIAFEDFTPDHVVIEIEVDGVIVFEGSFEPEYEAVYPNGPDCEPVCQQGLVTITL